MGKVIEQIAHDRGHTIVAAFSSSNPITVSALVESGADVAIEFSRPELAPGHISVCRQANIPVVVGTTGWYEHFEGIKKQFEQSGALFTATNFSIGVHIAFFMNRLLAATMNWNSNIDRISITHEAHNRTGFATGSVMAAEWIIGKQGVYSMSDMLNFETLVNTI